MNKIIRSIPGSRSVGAVYKDEDGYTYWKNRQCQSHFTVRCASWRAGCRAKGKILNDCMTNVILTTGHENQPINHLALQQFKNICNQRAQNEQTSLRLIYNETCAMADFINVHVGAFVSLHRTMRRHRRRNQPTTPQSMTEFHLQLTGEYAHLSMINDESIYTGIVGTTPEEGISLIFILPGVKNLLRTSSTFLMDGTFSSAPSFRNECQQLYVIMGITFNTGFPIGFALMSRKTERAYTAVFNKILSLIPDWRPQTIIVDFERAAIAAVKTLFPNTIIRGCWFHSSQAIWRKVGNIGLIEICKSNRGAYDTVHMLMALSLLPRHYIMEGFVAVKAYYSQHVQSLITNNVENNFIILFEYYQSTWLEGVNADILSVSDTVWRTNNVLEVSHQHLQMHVGNQPHPEPWMFLNGLITYSRGVLVDYDVATDGRSVREPQRQVWINQQRRLDSALRLFTEGRYSVAEFLICARHSTPTFGVLRPEHQAIPIVPTAVLPQASPIQAPLLINQSQELNREEILRRFIPLRPRVPIPRDFFDITPNHSDEDDTNEQPVVPTIIYLKHEDLTIVPKVEEKFYICLYSPPTVVAYPCSHQGLCKSCHESYITMPPNAHRPYYRCPLCRSAIDIYYILQ